MEKTKRKPIQWITEKVKAIEWHSIKKVKADDKKYYYGNSTNKGCYNCKIVQKEIANKERSVWVILVIRSKRKERFKQKIKSKHNKSIALW